VDTKAIKNAGEHWVCSALARMGWSVALTRDGLARTDILAVGAHLPGRPVREVQVKTATAPGQGEVEFVMGKAPLLQAESSREFYVLVRMPPFPVSPRTFVVPRDHAAAGTWIVHRNWASDPAATRNRNPENTARIKETVWAAYENRWDLLEVPEDQDLPVLLPPHLRPLATSDRVGLPPTHPWREGLPLW
jgi:hypothetical protein